MKTRFLGMVFGLLFVLTQSSAFGHMRWFVDQSAAFPKQHYTMDLTNWLLVAGGALLLLQISFTVSGLLVYVAAALALMFNSLSLMIDYVFEFAALGLSLILMGPHLSELDRRALQVFKIDLDRYRHLALFGIAFLLIACGGGRLRRKGEEALPVMAGEVA